MSTCLVVQHVPAESAFAIADALGKADVSVDVCRVFAGDRVPCDAAGLDGVVIMGGPMSAASDQDFPTRDHELALIADAVRTGIPTLGVCLGAQLVARALGAPVYPGEFGPEIGWSEVGLTCAGADDLLFAGVPNNLTVLQWHGDTFDLPPGAVHLMHDSIYPNQGFRVGEVAWGLQFHLEVNEEAVDGFLHAFASDLEGVPGGPEKIRGDTPTALAALAPSRDLVFGRFAALVAERLSSVDLVHNG